MKLSLKYRLMEDKDCYTIFQMGKESFGSQQQYSWDWSIKKVQEYLDASFGSAAVCIQKDKIIGFALAQNKYSEQKPRVAWFTYLFVDPTYQKKGIGRELLERVQSVLRDKGVTEMITDIYENNDISLQFFEGQGFEIKERWFILSKTLGKK